MCASVVVSRDLLPNMNISLFKIKQDKIFTMPSIKAKMPEHGCSGIHE
jgi:hypothetical protein